MNPSLFRDPLRLSSLYSSVAVRGAIVAATLAISLLVSSPQSAQAQFQITLDNPNPVYYLSQGATVLTFTGTIQNTTSHYQAISTYAISFPYTASNVPLSAKNGSSNIFGFKPLPTIFSPGSLFHGPLFTVALDQTTAPGIYNLSRDGNDALTIPPVFIAQGYETPTGVFFNERVPFSVTVSSGPAPVPEPSSLTIFGVAGSVLTILLLKGRKKIRQG